MMEAISVERSVFSRASIQSLTNCMLNTEINGAMLQCHIFHSLSEAHGDAVC